MLRPRKITVITLALILSTLGFLIANLDQLLALGQLRIARQALKDRDVDRALIAGQQASHLDPLNGEVYFTLARAFRRKGQVDKVREFLVLSAKHGVPISRLRREEWLTMAQSGQFKEAGPHLSELLLNPGDDGPEICEAYANGFFLMYQLAEAFSILDAWEIDYPNDPQPHVFRAEVSSKTDNWNATVTHLRRAIELAPNRVDVRIKLAKALLMLQELGEAEQLFEQLLIIQPDHPDVLLGCAQVFLERGQSEQARSTLDRLLRGNSKHNEALRLLGELHLSSGRTAEAIKLLEQAHTIKHNDRQVRYALGTALKKAGRDDEARQHFQFVAQIADLNSRVEKLVGKVRTDNSDVQSRFEIAELLAVTGEHEERLMWLRSVVALDPKHKAAHTELAKHYVSKGNLEESRKHRRLAGME